MRGYPWLAAMLGLGLVACSGPIPPQDSATLREDIVGGQVDPTDHGVFGIIIKDQSMCSGTLIAPNLVLTARHCVADVSTGDDPIDCTTSTFGTKYNAYSFVLSSASDLTANVPQSAVYHASDVRVPDDTAVCGNDVALLILDANVASSAATPLEPRVDQAPQDNEAFTAVGYGLTDPSDTQGTTVGVRHDLSGLSVGCVGAIDCIGTRARDDEWAANAAICHGDSGGPAIDANGLVIGVASRADTACSTGLYSSVAAWQSLIVSTALDAATAGGYQPADWVTANSAGSMGGTSSTGGTNDTSSPDAGSSLDDGGGLVTPGPELGEACTDGCFGDLVCYSSSGKPPGVCVQSCTAEDTTCPATSECNAALGACIPATHATKAGAGCSIGEGERASGSAWFAFAAVAFCGGMLRRRRRS
jgi:Trypsin